MESPIIARPFADSLGGWLRDIQLGLGQTQSSSHQPGAPQPSSEQRRAALHQDDVHFQVPAGVPVTGSPRGPDLDLQRSPFARCTAFLEPEW